MQLALLLTSDSKVQHERWDSTWLSRCVLSPMSLEFVSNPLDSNRLLRFLLY